MAPLLPLITFLVLVFSIVFVVKRLWSGRSNAAAAKQRTPSNHRAHKLEGSLRGRVVIITGGASGLGLESAKALTRKGAHVIITTRNQARGEAAVQLIRKTLHQTNGMEHSIALVTGTTSGLGYAAAHALAEEGWREIIVTGRSMARVQEAAAQLAAESKMAAETRFTPLALELDDPISVQSALAELVKRGRRVDFLLLNAGLVGGAKRVLTKAGIEESEAPLIGHHQLTVGLLNANLLSPNARIVIAGSEAARGDLPMFSYTDVAALAAKHHQGDRTAAVEALVRSGPSVKYEANRAYADAKLIVAWWAAALARRLPPGMAVYAVSPGSAPDTKAVRNASLIMRNVLIPLVKLMGMFETPEIAARRYLQASEFGTDVSGQFFASPPKKVIGPMEVMRHPHFHDRANQEAAWQAVVKVSGVDLQRKQQPQALPSAPGQEEEQEAVSPHGVIEYGVMDNAKIETVQSFVQWFNKRNLPLHVLMLNAATGFQPHRTVQGTEETILVNHLAHFHLTNLLLPNLERTAKADGAPTCVVVVTNTSQSKVKSPVDWAARFTLPAEGFNMLSAYVDTKLANIQFALELSRRLQRAHVPVLVNAVNPGVVETQMMEAALRSGVFKRDQLPPFVGPATGALTQLYVATSPDLSQKGKAVTGAYFVLPAQRGEIGPVAANEENARELWRASEARVQHHLTAQI